MPKKTTTAKKTEETPTASTPAKKTTTAVRNTAVPKVAKAATIAAKATGIAEPTFDQIARRAYEIYSSGDGGSEADNWLRAERELRAGV